MTQPDVFHALGDKTRMAIIQKLAGEGAQKIGTIAQAFEMTRPAVAKHLGVLEAARVIRFERRGREKLCHLEPHTLAAAAHWLQRHEALWVNALDGLAAYVEENGDDNDANG
ncbi:MAG: metalloregulator ArsR/SmtB family transcription factor [Pseudomonadota bacterium]